MHDPRIDAFLRKIAVSDNSQALSDAKFAELGNERQTVVIEEDGSIVAIAVLACHRQSDGEEHFSVESALEPGLRFDAFEDKLLASALTLVPPSVAMSVWSHRYSLDAALQRAGFGIVRELARMEMDLPVAESGNAIVTRPFRVTDTDAVVALNRVAFAPHREAASLNASDVTDLMAQDGFDDQGFLILEDGHDLVGFCWTRIHENGDGEIFRIAVSPDHQGGGVGRSLAIAGFNHLDRQPGVERGMLWVDTANRPAVSLYEDIGLTQADVNREFERRASD